MAAILEPRRLHPAAPPAARPALRLVPAGGGRPVDVPLDAPLSLGLGPVHLLAAVAALVVVLFTALAIGNGSLAALAPAPAAPAVGAEAAPAAGAESAGTITVQPGDSLWSIARRLQPAGDVRALVDQLQALNGSAPLQAGTQLRIPA